MNILKEGVKSALVRIVRLIVYSLIVLVVFYIIGLITSHKASALSYKSEIYDPAYVQNTKQGYVFGPGNANHWFHWDFASNWTNTTDYDLLGFKLNTYVGQVQNNSGLNILFQDYYTIQAILWTSNNYGVPCYLSGEYLDTFLCPINKNETYHSISIIANAFDPIANINLELQVELERTRILLNYDSTDIISYFENSQTGIGQIVIQQQQTTQVIQDTNDYITDNTTTGSETQAENSLNTISGQFNDALNGWGGQWSDVTHIVLEPINVMLYVLDPATACRPITLNVPFVNTTITLPCYGAAFSQFFPTLMSLVVIIFSGLYGYRTVMYILRTLKGVLDAEDDKIEVIDL